MDVRLPNGQIVANVPEGTTKKQLLDKLAQSGYDVAPLQRAMGAAPIGAEGMGQALQQVGAEQNYGGQFATGIANVATRLPSALLQLPSIFGGPDLRPETLREVREPLSEATKGAGVVGSAGDIASGIAMTIPLLPARAGAAMFGPKFLSSRLGQVADVASTSGVTGFATTEGGIGERAKAAALSTALSSALPGALAIGQATRREATQAGRELGKAEFIRSQLGGEGAEQLALALRKPYEHAALGVRPSAAMLTESPALRTLELGSRVKRPDLYAAIDEANAAARWAALQRAAGGAEDLAQAQSVRDTLTRPLRESALSQAAARQGFEIPVARQAAKLLTGEGKADPSVRRMANYVLGELEEGITPEGLYRIRKVLTEGIPRGTELGAAISAAKAERMSIVKTIDDALNKASAGTWGGYLKVYQGMSEPVTSMKALQAIEQKFNPADLPGIPPAFGAAPASQYLGRELAKHGVKQFGSKTFDRMSSTDRKLVEALIDDLRRQQSVMKAGGVIGSDTAAKLAAGERAENLALGLFGTGLERISPVPGIGTAVGTIAQKGLAARRERALAELLQNPEKLADLLAKAKRSAALIQGSAELSRATRPGS